MTAPSPVPGVNPYTLGYQKKQFAAGAPGDSESALDSLYDPPEDAAAAKAASDPLAERAANLISPQDGIIPN